MILRARNQDVELRTEWGHSSDISNLRGAWLSNSGESVTQDRAFGIPAVSNVIRSPAEIIASLPYLVYEKGEGRERAENTWQWKLLHDQPSQGCDTYEFFYDLALSLEATQNAFIQKAKYNGRVYELYVVDPQRVTVRRDKQGRKRFDVYVDSGTVMKDMTSEDILHIRGFTPSPGGAAGVSLIHTHRDSIGAQLAMQQFEGDYFRNNAQPPFWFTGAKNQQHAQDLLAAHNAAHQGGGHQWRPGAMWGEADVKQLPLSLEDAMFADAKRLSIEDACRIWRWPRELVELSSNSGVGSPGQSTDTVVQRMLKFSLLPRLKRIERAFASDPDLYPPSGIGTGRGAGSKLFGEFLTSALERADFVTRVRGYKDARQGSWITANEIRALENMPPVEGGDEVLITPTGSSPNPENDSAPPEDKEPSQ